MQHLAIVRPIIITAIMDGHKVCESRLSRVPTPVRHAQAGDEILFKATGGDVELCAVIDKVEHYNSLRPTDIVALRDLYDRYISAPGLDLSEYWCSKASAKYASFMWLSDLCALHIPASKLPRSYGCAWFADWPRLP